MTSWQDNESLQNANEVFSSRLSADPFEGAAVVDALAGVIDSVDKLPQNEARGISPAVFGHYILERINQAQSAAEAAGASTYAQILEAQAKGWEATQKIEEKSEQPQSAPTDTTKKPMSDKKS